MRVTHPNPNLNPDDPYVSPTSPPYLPHISPISQVLLTIDGEDKEAVGAKIQVRCRGGIGEANPNPNPERGGVGEV